MEMKCDTKEKKKC